MNREEAIERLDGMKYWASFHNGSYKEELEALDMAIEDMQKQIPKPMKAVKYCDYYSTRRYYCPVCGKQQKLTHKNIHEGCYCERCGQLLEPMRGETDD